MRQHVSLPARALLLALVFAACVGASPRPSPTPTPNPIYGQLKWRNVGPAGPGGRVAAVAGSTWDPFLYYVGAAGGGVWKSENGGGGWEPVFTRQAVAAIGAVTIDPTNDSTVWVGTGEANPRNDVSYGDGVYKSTDGGKTWRNTGVRGARYIARIAVNPDNPKVVLVAAIGDVFADNPNGGIWRTDDGGRTWRHTLYVGPRSGGSDLAIDPKNPNTVFAGIWQVRRVPWTLSSGGPQDGLYRSRDGGKTWMKLAGHGLPGGLMGRIGLAIAPSRSQRVYALIQSKDGVLWRSDDSGASWRMMSNDTLVNQRPFYFSHIEVDPANSDHVYGVSEFVSESKNGGRTFKQIAEGVHVDFHAMWIAPHNPKRIIVGEDGGYSLTADGGKNWSFSANLPIGQAYHTAFDDQNPYHVCAPLQDNNAFCGPANGLNPDGITNSMWKRVVGGDGMWAVPDPADPARVWVDSQDGYVSIYDERTNTSRSVRPFYATSTQEFSLHAQRYRFNWDSPIAVAPWNPRVVWIGANVVFQTTDEGAHWQPISPDLTRDIKSHQHPSGGPISLDVSSAEFSDNLLDIEGSTLAKNEIWVGSDDGLVQLTRDGGRHWSNVTPRGAPQFGRVETVAPSPSRDGTAYAIFDDHRMGNYKPYAYATNDFGSSWRSITNGLPADQYVRTVRPDIRNPNVLYAGTEQGVWISYDDGGHWQSLQLNLPPVSVRDIRIQPTFDDIVIATHGRALWIFDDATPIQDLPRARSQGAALLPIRLAYEYALHSDDEGIYDRFAAANPPLGAIINFYQNAPQAKPAAIQIRDSKGRIVRTLAGMHKVHQRNVPYVTNDRTLNRVVWNFREDGPVKWMGASKEEYRGPDDGALVVPGTYSVSIALGGRTLTQNVDVRPDPRSSFTPADFQARYNFAHAHFVEYSNIDSALNALDAAKKGLDRALAAVRTRGAGSAALLRQIQAVSAQRERLFAELTANYRNDEDSIMRPGALREDVEELMFRASAPPLPALTEYAAGIDERYRAAMRSFTDFETARGQLNARLKSVNVTPIP